MRNSNWKIRLSTAEERFIACLVASHHNNIPKAMFLLYGSVDLNQALFLEISGRINSTSDPAVRLKSLLTMRLTNTDN